MGRAKTEPNHSQSPSRLEPGRPMARHNPMPNVDMMIAGDLDDCTKVWNDFISNNGPKNPYMILDDQYMSKCSHGIGKVAGYV